MHKEKSHQVKKARFMIVYAVLYCVKGNKETQTHICMYTHTHITMSGRTDNKFLVVVTYLRGGRVQGRWVTG